MVRSSLNALTLVRPPYAAFVPTALLGFVILLLSYEFEIVAESGDFHFDVLRSAFWAVDRAVDALFGVAEDSSACWAVNLDRGHVRPPS
jgi:hypothetical protein